MNALIDQMREPEFYAHEVDAPIEVVQTHISFVVLTGPYAYKIKKPVDLGFLDFTTLEKRHHYCLEELRLNQAFAPDLYLEVVSIYERDGRYTLHRSGEDCKVVEYAVRMRQFAESDLLINVFDRGEIDLDFAGRLGARIAAVHEAAPVVRPAGSFGSAEAMAESVRQNFETIRPFAGPIVPQQLFEDLRTFLDTFIEENRRLFERRLEEGRIRECHGDLHLRNICLHEGRIELFDRIEFNDAFKNIDVMYDLAFLLMDIRYRGGRGIANRLLNAYLETTGDYSGALMLPFYQSVRALIRGEVALLLSADQDVDAPRREQAGKDGLRHLEHALEFTHATQGRLIVTCGLSGSGKSTFARTLSQRIDAIHIRSDAVRKHLAGVDLSEHGEAIYSEAYSTATYSKLIERGILLAERGFSVILDAKFDRRELRRKLVEKATSFDLPVRFVHCHAPLDVLKKRLTRRFADVSDATEDLIDSQAMHFESFEGEEKETLISLDTQDEDATERVINEVGD